MAKLKEVMNQIGITEGQVKKLILCKKTPKPKILKRYISNQVFQFGVVGDTHACSTHEKLNELHTFYDICRKQGIKVVFHAGDIVAGWGVYKGQENEVHTFGAEGQADYVINNYPKVPGITTYFITGNHCLSFYARSGVDVGRIISEKRKDMIYLGQCGGKLAVSGIHFEMLHPDGGGAYAASYSIQKRVEGMVPGNKPDIYIEGHDHTALYIFLRNVHCIRAGCFEGQTLFLKRKGIMPAIGGWICKARKGKGRDHVVALSATFVPFF